MVWTVPVLLPLALLLAAARAAAEVPAPILHHDPFERPRPVSTPVAAAERPAVAPPAPWQASLRATMVAGERSMANVDGNILPLGRVIDGFRLVEVQERLAVFERNGERHVLRMDSPPETVAAEE